jgi:hypothetical protein
VVGTHDEVTELHLRKLKAQPGILIALLALLYPGCDPGYELRPVGWQPVSEHKWAKQFGDFELQTPGIRGLIGEWSVDPELEIYNNTKPLSVESAELHTANETFQAKVYRDSPIPPSKSGYHFPISWEFERERAAPEVLGNHCEIILNLKVGSDERQIKIEYEK